MTAARLYEGNAEDHASTCRTGKSTAALRLVEFTIRLSDHAGHYYHCPAADVLFESAGTVIGPNNLSCVMTGMGMDGTRGLLNVRHNGGYILAQSEKSCVIYGMPRSAVESGLVDEVVDLDDLPEVIMGRISRGPSSGGKRH
jgi:two-component system chemotaxis response regulator CheB